MVLPYVNKELVPLLVTEGRYQAEHRHHGERRIRIEDHDIHSLEKIPMEVPHNITLTRWTPGRYPRSAQKLFIIIAFFAFVFIMYTSSYKPTGVRPGSVLGWSYNTSRDTRTYVLPDNVTLLNQPKGVCRGKSSTPEPRVFLLVIICSAMDNFDKRAAIRETWGSQRSFQLLRKTFRDIADKFSRINMTENLYNEMGYSEHNMTSVEARMRRGASAYDDISLAPNSTNFNTLDSDSKKEALYIALHTIRDKLISRSYVASNLDSYSNIRSKRESNDQNDVEDQRFDNGKATAYDENAVENEVEKDDNILGNFEGNDVEEEQTFQDYEYQTEESNIMQIPPRGVKLSEADDKALEEAKNLMSLSLKGDKLSLTYHNPKASTKSERFAANDRASKIPDIKSPVDDSRSHSEKNGINRGGKLGDDDSVEIKFLYMLGQAANENDTELQSRVDEEASTYGDIIQEAFVDSYNNLTLKSVMLLKWVITHCGENVHYVMKTDDDTFVNVPRLIDALQNKSREFQRTQQSALKPNRQSEKLLMGDLICNARPISDMQSKWYSPKYMYSGRVYPRYLSGSGYVMSLGAAELLYRSALNLPLFHLEDVFITGMCSGKAGIRPTDHPGFFYGTRKPHTCVYAHLITAHRVSPLQMRTMHRALSSPAAVRRLEACEAQRALATPSLLDSAREALFLGSPKSIISGLAGFGYADAKRKKLKKANACS